MILIAFVVNIAIYAPGAKITIHIEDQVHGEDYLVSDMPLALAAPAALSSEMSRYLVKLVEAFYMGPSIPFELRMSENNTYNFASKIMTGLQDITVSDPMTKATFNSYMKECVIPDMYQGKIKLNEVLNSPPENFWQTIRVNNLARMSICFQHCAGIADGATCPASECPAAFAGADVTGAEWRSGMAVSCPGGHTALGERITSLIGATAFNEIGNTLLRDTSLLDGVISSTITHVTGVTGASGTEHFVRAGMMNMFRESSSAAIANGGGEGLINVLGTEQAKASQRTNWVVSSKVFAESVAYLWAALQAFIFAIFPIAIVLFLFPGLGTKAMAGYFGLLAWISLWMPFLAIINFLSISWLVEDVRQLAMIPLSYGSLLPISEAGANMQAVTTFLGTMVPVLTYGMVRGGEFALTQIAQDASAPKAAENASREIASKSFTYGSIAANNFGANKLDGTSTVDFGTNPVNYKEGTGAATSNQQRGFAARSVAGSYENTNIQAQSSAGFEVSGSAGKQVGTNLATEASSTSSLTKAAEIAAGSSRQGSRAFNELNSESASLTDSVQRQTQSGQEFAESFRNSISASSQLSENGQVLLKGAAAGVALAGAVGAEALGGFNKDAGESLIDRLKTENGGKEGAVATGLNKLLSAQGIQFSNDKDAETHIRNVTDLAESIQTANPNLSKGDVVSAVGTTGLASLSDEDLNKVDERSIGRRTLDFIKENKGDLALAAATLIPGAFLAGAAVKGGIIAYRGIQAANLGTKLAAGAAAAAGGVAAVDGDGTKLDDVANLSGGAGGSKNIDGKKGGVLAALKSLGDVTTAVSVTGRQEQARSAGIDDSSRNSNSTTTGVGQAYSLATLYQQSDLKTQQAANSLQATVRNTQQNASTTGVRSGTVGADTTGFQRTDSAGNGVTVTSNKVVGGIDSLFLRQQIGDTPRQVATPAAVGREFVGAAREIDARVNGVNSSFDTLKKDVDTKNPGGRNVVAPGVPDLENNALGRARGAVGREERQGNVVTTPGAQGQFSDVDFAGEQQVFKNFGESQQERDQRIAALGATSDKLRGVGEQATRYGLPLTAYTAAITAGPDALRSAGAAGQAIRLSLEGSETLNKTLEFGRYNGVSSEGITSEKGSIFGIRDQNTGASIAAVGRDNGQSLLAISNGDDEKFGQFLKSDNGRLFGASPEQYKDLSPVEAAARYREANRAEIDGALNRLK
nr:conjugal transfer protein TraG N-terminal domain-containing protein [Nevskia ramosa]